MQADAKSVYDVLYRLPKERGCVDDDRPDRAVCREVGCWSHASSRRVRGVRRLRSTGAVRCRKDRNVDFDLDQLNLDGSGVDLSFRSSHQTPGFSECIRYTYFPDTDGAAPAIRFGCYRWFDGKQHDVRILSGTEADKIGKLVVDIYDVVGLPDGWNGSGDPPSTLTHQYVTFPFVASRQQSPDVHIAIDGEVPAVSRSFVVRAINAAARGILLCAHPTANYRSVTVNDVRFSSSSVNVDFRINYMCTIVERPCHLDLRAGFHGRAFQGITVLEDTALTDPSIGLGACRQLVNALLN